MLHSAQLKYVAVGEQRVVTNSKYIAEQVKNDRGGKLVTDGPKVVKKNEVMNGRKIGKVMESNVMNGQTLRDIAKL